MDTQQITNLRVKLMKLAKSLRVCVIPPDADLEKPQGLRDDQVIFEGKSIHRRRIVLLTPKCTSSSCLMCPLPNEALDDRTITPEQIIKQYDSCFGQPNDGDVETISIYTNGNFFADNEIPPVVKEHIYRHVSTTNAKYLLVESLPQFITEEKLELAKKYLKDKVLITAVGLQSSSDLVRQISVNTTCTQESFEKSYHLSRKYGFDIQAFLMIKPPFLTETEAINDCVDSIGYLYNLGINNPTLCACRAAPNTVLSLLHQDGKYDSPWLWSVAEVMIKSAEKYPQSTPMLVLNEIRAEKNPDSTVSHNCDECSPNVIHALERFNSDRDVAALKAVTHSCYSKYLEQRKSEDEYAATHPLEMRVEQFVADHAEK